MITVLVALAVAIVTVNLVLVLGQGQRSDKGRLYNVEINRIVAELAAGTLVNDIDLAQYPHISAVETLAMSTAQDTQDTQDAQDMQNTQGMQNAQDIQNALSTQNDFFNEQSTIVRLVGDQYVRFEFIEGGNTAFFDVLLLINSICGALFLFALILLLYLRQTLIKPFAEFNALPLLLAKGHLDTPLAENKSRYFGRFIWGLDNLRETLRAQRAQALSLERERKTITLALSHDIKTPLSAMRLYTQALQEGLYDDPERRQKTLVSIIQKTDEIEDYLNRLVRSSSEDLLQIDVTNGEFFLDDLLTSLQQAYAEKLEILGVPLRLGSHTNRLLAGDQERALEALENLFENALKYGNGTVLDLNFLEEDGALLVTLANRGNSLPAAETTHIFESFWRGSNAQGISGNGLGLYIVRKIMQQIGGDVYATAQSDTMAVTLVFKLA
jgi:signal transduction histidine kinase